MKKYSKSPDIPLQLFNKFCTAEGLSPLGADNWMNQKKRVDYLINQNRNSIIDYTFILYIIIVYKYFILVSYT